MVSIPGGPGNDSLGPGIPGGPDAGTNDTITGAGGNDSLFGGLGNDSLLGEAGSDQLFGGEGNDQLFGGTGTDSLDGGLGNDTLDGGTSSDRLFGDVGDDYFFAGAAANGDNDLIDGGSGSDTVDFSQVTTQGVSFTVNSTGTVTVAQGTGGGVNSRTDTLVGIENVIGTTFSDAITGDNAANFLSGGSGNDTLSGGDGDDTIAGGPGNDLLSGGGGIDTLTYANSSTAVNANLASGSAIGESNDAISGFENLIGSANNDTLIGNGDANVIDGRAGADSIFGGSGDDSLLGGSGNDSIGAGEGNDTVDAGSGADSVSGGSGNDLIFGGSGAPIGTTYITNGTFTGGGAGWTGTDTEFNPESAYFGGASSNGVTEIDGNAGQTTQLNQSFTVEGAGSAALTFRGIVRTSGDVGVDGYRVQVLDSLGNVVVGQDIRPPSNTLWTNYSIDVSFPAAGTYTLRFTELGDDDSTGALVDDVQITATTAMEDLGDTLLGGEGLDTIYGEAGNDLISGDADADLLFGGVGNDVVEGGGGNDVLSGGIGDDTLSGGTDDDRLDGEEGNDSLRGDSGSDTLFGGAGTDSMFGGDGNDFFIYSLNDVTPADGFEVVFGGGGPGAPDGDNDRLDVSAYGIEYGWRSVVITRLADEDGIIDLYDRDPALEGAVLLGSIDFNNIENIIICFTPGTMILTSTGERPVETLMAGDLIMTRDNGLQPLRWVGQRHLSRARLVADPDLQPVRIAAGALGLDGPERSMMVSPQHRVLVTGARAELLFGEDEVLVPARHLVGSFDVSRALPEEGVTYVHILFDRHEIVHSDGIWTESFQPAERMLNAMEAEVRDEILRIFPELAFDTSAFDGARLSLKAHEARVLFAG